MDSNKRSGPPAGGAPAPKRPATGADDEPFFDDEMEEDDYLLDSMDAAPAVVTGNCSNIVQSHLESWRRPTAPRLDPAKDKLVFMQVELDNVAGDNHRELQPNSPKPVPIIRLFGVTEEGYSVNANVYGFEPYFWVPAPAGFGPDDCEAFRSTLNAATGDNSRGAGANCPVYVVRVEMHERMSVMHYQPNGKRAFLRIVTLLPGHVATCRTVCERGVNTPNCGVQHFQTYESSVLYPLRYMIDRDVVGGNWVEAPAGTYKLKSEQQKLSTCQYEIDIRYEDLISHPCEGEFQNLGRMRILSFDIECAGRKGHFPEPDQDPVIQIANMVTVQGDSTPCIKNVLTLGTCAPIVGAEVISFQDERELLRTWAALVRESDPDLLIGYNIMNFDMWYLLERARHLGVGDFNLLGRVRSSRTRIRDATFSSKAHGTRESKEYTVEGRVVFDLFQSIQRDHKLSSYSLNAVSAHFLGEQKEDVHHSAISDLQNGNEETRRRLAVYCLKDAYLPQRLLDKLLIVFNYIEMARVTGVPISYLLSRGQSIKVYSQLLRKAKQKSLLVPVIAKQGSTDNGVAYEGATVLEAKAGFYEDPIATLDFASLYPSIMMAHNLCYSSLVPREMVRTLSPEDYITSPTGDVFMKKHKVKGILPEILEELLAARKRAKKDLKEAKDPQRKAVLDGRQLALKVSANSVYGFTGATVGKLPCLEISGSVTAFGRNMIEHTKNLVHEHFSIKNGYTANAEVIYGDTDSVMVNFKTKDLATAMKLGIEASEVITKTFEKPINLEFEKVYYPYLLISKKRYAGLIWTNEKAYDKMDTKGIETVRRDNCLLVKNVVTQSLDHLLINRDVKGAVEYVKGTISDLLMNRIDISLLVVTKGLTQNAEDYDNKQAHVELAKRMMKRDPATAPGIGDRVPYVIIKAAKGAKGFEKSEDPIYALENNLPIDAQHYLEHYLMQPLTRIFEPIMKDAKGLFSGAHTRSISNPTPSTAGIMRFAKVTLKCLGCKAPITDKERTLCKHCTGRQSELYLNSLQSVNELESQFSKLWTECQRCTGTLAQDVLCTSRDCPIFYRRKKVQKDLGEAEATLRRWDW